MDILIIGGSGFVSGTLARQAVSEGHRVWVVTRGRRPLPARVTALTADRHDDAAFRTVIGAAGVHFDLAVDCIGYDPEDALQDVDFLRTRARHLVFISTDFVFDPRGRRFPRNDDNACFLTDDSYGARKRRCEETILAADTGEMSWTILRPCHIYGPGSRLGCLPEHGRDPDLVARLRRREALRLVGGGRFLQQPIFAPDLARIALACPGAPAAAGRIFHTAGPEIIESVEYYRILAAALGVDLEVEEVQIAGYLTAHPEHRSFLCHRIYDLHPLRAAGLPVPGTRMEAGLGEHLRSLLEDSPVSRAG